MAEKRIDRKLAIGIIGTIGFVTLCILAIIFYDSASTSDPQIRITNFGSYYRNAPSSTQVDIQVLLYKTVLSNTDGSSDLSSVTGSIRSEGVVDDYDPITDVHTGSFVIDLPAVSQSYAISFDWARFNNNPHLSQYGVIITCLDESMLTYGFFPCSDILFSTGDDDYGDPITQYLPHSTLNYEITYAGIGGGLIVKIVLSASEERIDPEGSINRYKEQALSYIRSAGVNPDDYTIEWRVQRPTL